MLLAHGYGMAIAFMVLTMTKRMSALISLAPIAFRLLAASPSAICKKGRLASANLLVGQLDIHYGDNQKALVLWVFGLVLAMIGCALLFGVLPFVSTI